MRASVGGRAYVKVTRATITRQPNTIVADALDENDFSVSAGPENPYKTNNNDSNLGYAKATLTN
jgi:hypothetical protein